MPNVHLDILPNRLKMFILPNPQKLTKIPHAILPNQPKMGQNVEW